MNAEEKYWYWSSLAHKVHHTFSATDDTFIASQHPLCPVCNPHLVEGDVKPWEIEELDEPTIRSNGSRTGTTAAALRTSASPVEAPAATPTATPVAIAARLDGLTAKDDPATPAAWAYEPRAAYLERKLKHYPHLAIRLIADGLWTGTYDPDGRPIPSEVAFHSGLWQREVWPVYAGPEPELNKMRSLRDTLILRPVAGPHLIAAGLWTGEYDAQGLPIPTPTPIDNRRRR